MDTKICLECGKEFIKPYNCSKKSWVNVMFCSRKCKCKSKIVKDKVIASTKGIPRPCMIGHEVTLETRKKISEKRIGFIVSEETRKKISISSIGRKTWNKGKPAHWTSERNRLTNKKRVGEKHPNWKGGISDENTKIRASLEYKLWRESCFLRDNYTCKKTGEVGGKLRCHHIVNFSDNPNLRLDLNNGITLSSEAHKEFHRIYGIKNNTKEQLIEFLNN